MCMRAEDERPQRCRCLLHVMIILAKIVLSVAAFFFAIGYLVRMCCMKNKEVAIADDETMRE